MPVVAVGVAALAVSSAIATSSTVIALVGSAFVASLLGGLAGAVINFAGSALFGVDKPQAFGQKASARVQSVKQPIATHKIVYGQIRVGGDLTFLHVSGSSSQYLNLIYTISARQVFKIDGVYFNEDYCPTDYTDTVYPVVSAGRYIGTAVIYTSDGTAAQDAALSAALQPFAANWLSSSVQAGRAKAYVRMAWDQNIYGPTGIPNVTFLVRGRMVYDPRKSGVTISGSTGASPAVFTTTATHGLSVGNMVWIKNHTGAVPSVDQEYEIGTVPTTSEFTLLDHAAPVDLTTGGSGGTVTLMGWSDNAALIASDQIVDPTYGLAATYSTEIDETQLISAANTCDETVNRASLFSENFTILTQGGASYLQFASDVVFGQDQTFPIGKECVVSVAGGSLPAPLAANTVYYIIPITSTLCQLATTLKNAQTGVLLPITSSGSGTLTLSQIQTFSVRTFKSGKIGSEASLTEPFTQLLLSDGSSRILTGTQVQVAPMGSGAEAGTLPTGLSANTTYYAILFVTRSWPDANDITYPVIQLATSLANARAGIAVQMSDAGSGVNYITVQAEPRFTANGIADSEQTSEEALNAILSAMAGYVVFAGGLYGIYPGIYRTPTVTLDEGDLRGPIEVQTLASASDSFNSVKGVFADPFSQWQPTDFPWVQDAAYIAADQGETVWQDLSLPWTTSSAMAQRLAVIALQRVRRELTVTMRCKLTAFPVGVPDTIQVNNAMWGWTEETFEVQSWSFTPDTDANGEPLLGIDIVARQTDSTVFSWDTTKEIPKNVPVPTTLPDPFTVQPPTGLALASGPGLLYIRLDGTVMSRIGVSWTQPTDQFVINGGFIEVQYKLTSTSTWIAAAPVPGDQTQTYILDVQDGAQYDVQARSQNSLGVYSDTTEPWQSQVLGYTVLGENLPPSDVPSINVVQNGSAVIITAGGVPDLDVAVIEFRFGIVGATWASMTLIEQAAARPSVATSITTASIPPGTWSVAAEAKDTSGNYSTDATIVTATIGPGNLLPVTSLQQDPGWAGLTPGASPDTSTGCFLHYTGKVVPNGLHAWSTYAHCAALPHFYVDPVAQWIYEMAPEIDLGSNDTVQFYSSPLTVVQAPGVSGTPSVQMQVDNWADGAGDPQTWANFTAGNLTGRYIRARLVGTPGSMPGYVTNWTPVATKQQTTQSASNVTIANGGTAITFNPSFHDVPSLTVTPSGAAIAWYTSLTASGATLHVGSSASVETGGTASWQAVGT